MVVILTREFEDEFMACNGENGIIKNSAKYFLKITLLLYVKM